MGLTDDNIVFTSYEATGVEPGANIPEYIRKNIKSASIVLSMISSNYKQSEVCMNEVGAAWALDKPPVQILLPGANFTQLGWLTNTDKAIRIDDGDGLDALMEVICNALKIPFITPKHWNPCKKDFLSEVSSLPKEQSAVDYNCHVLALTGEENLVLHPIYKRIEYWQKMATTVPKTTEISPTTSLSTTNSLMSTVMQLHNIHEVIRPTSISIIKGHENKSFCQVRLALNNNGRKALENGKIIICSDTDGVKFAETNRKMSSTMDTISNFLPRIHQSVRNNGVTEDFPNPINPSACEELYDFYVSAPSDIGMFKLKWKFESLQAPIFGEMKVEWNPEYEEKFEYVQEGDDRIGTFSVSDCIVDIED